MPKATFQAAREMIRAGDYNGARIILRQINHPQAGYWLTKIDHLEWRHQAHMRQTTRMRQLVFSSVGVLLVTCGLYALWLYGVDTEAPAALPTVAPLVTPTGTQTLTPTITASHTATRVPTSAATLAQTPDSTVTAMLRTLSAQETAAVTVTISATATWTLTHAPPSAEPPQLAYLQRVGNARACPRIDCERLMTLQPGTQVFVLAIVQGQMYQGSDVWIHVLRDGVEMYMHGSLLGENPPQPTASPTNPPPITPTPAVQQAGAFSCDCGKSCTAMLTCEEAYFQLNQCGCGNKDRDGDGVPCERLCGG